MRAVQLIAKKDKLSIHVSNQQRPKQSIKAIYRLQSHN